MNGRKMLLVSALLAAASPVLAKEGPDQFRPGSDTFSAGNLPDRGWHFSNELTYSDGLLVRFDYSNPMLPEVHFTELTQWQDTLRFTYVSDMELLGGEVGLRFTAPLLRNNWQDTEFGADVFSSVGDVSVASMLGWHHERLHVTAGLEVYFPTGRFDAALPSVSTGANYYSMEPSVGLTYLTPGFEASTKVAYNMKGKNIDTDYRSADELRADFLVAWMAGQWTYGISGYWINQAADDQPGGGQSREPHFSRFGLGPVVRYTDSGRRTYSLEYVHDRNDRYDLGDGQFTFRFTMPF